jgi:hypothetical protein
MDSTRFTPDVTVGIVGNTFSGHGNFLNKLLIKEKVPNITPYKKPEINILTENWSCIKPSAYRSILLI